MAKKDYDTVAIGSRIRSIRQAKGMTLEEFGNLFSASKSIASRWEKGISIPNADRLKSIAKIGDTTVEELLHGNKEQFIRQTAIELIRQYREDIRNGAPGKEARASEAPSGHGA